MKSISRSMLLLLSVLMMSSTSHGEDVLPIPDGPYFGQKSPGSTPKVFAPGIVATKGWEYGVTFTSDMKEMFYLREIAGTNEHEFVVFKNKNNRWYETVISKRVGQPFVAPDGKTIHLGKRYMERTNSGLSEVKILDGPFKDMLIMRLTASAKGTYVMDKLIKNENGEYEDAPIHLSRLIDGKREEPQPLGKEINAGKWNSHPFIAPDESYIIWDSDRNEGYGKADIYISYRQQDGSWGSAINMGDTINTGGWDAAASVTPDGKYILFHRDVDADGDENATIYWVDAQIIEDLRPD